VHILQAADNPAETMSTQLPRFPFFVPPYEPEHGGVDFLGLRQANLEMMATYLPAINNVTVYIRAFSLLSWIHWKFHELSAASPQLGYGGPFCGQADAAAFRAMPAEPVAYLLATVHAGVVADQVDECDLAGSIAVNLLQQVDEFGLQQVDEFGLTFATATETDAQSLSRSRGTQYVCATRSGPSSAGARAIAPRAYNAQTPSEVKPDFQ
jgi:hypothetical protein